MTMGADSYLDRGNSWCSGKEPACQRRRRRFDPWVEKIPWRRKQPTSGMLAWRIPKDRGPWWATVHGVAESRT